MEPMDLERDDSQDFIQGEIYMLASWQSAEGPRALFLYRWGQEMPFEFDVRDPSDWEDAALSPTDEILAIAEKEASHNYFALSQYYGIKRQITRQEADALASKRDWIHLGTFRDAATDAVTAMFMRNLESN
jgi:hypothetical protein